MDLQLKSSLANIANRVEATEENRTQWLQYATGKPAVRLISSKKLIVLVAAILCVGVLAGAGTIASRYFNGVFGIGTAGEISGSTVWTPMHTDIPAGQLEEWLGDIAPGGTLNTTYQADGEEVAVQAVRGDNLDHLILIGEQSNADDTLFREGFTGRMPEDTLEPYLRAGEFMAALEGYALQQIRPYGSGTYRIDFTGPDGEVAQIALMPGRWLLSEEEAETAVVKDLTIGSNTFLSIQYADTPDEMELHLLLEGSRYNLITLTMLEGTSQQLLKAAEHLVLYNQSGNTAKAYDEAFFKGLSDPVLKANASEIAAAVASGKYTVSAQDEYDYILWEKDGRKIIRDSYDQEIGDNSRLRIEYRDMGYSDILRYSPLPSDTPFGKEDWFQTQTLRFATYFYLHGELYSARFQDETGELYLDYLPSIVDTNRFRNGILSSASLTERDALALNAFFSAPQDFSEIRSAATKGGKAVLVHLPAETAYRDALMIQAVVKQGGTYHSYSIHLPGEQTGDYNRWIASNLS